MKPGVITTLLAALNIYLGVTLTWSPRPEAELVISYYVYEHQGTNYVPLGPTPVPMMILTNVTDGDHCYVVTSSNLFGESLLSNEACTNVSNLTQANPRPTARFSSPGGRQLR